MEEHAETLAVAAIGGVTGLIVSLVVILSMRNWVLRKLFGRTEVALTEVTNSLIATVSAASVGDRKAAENEAKAMIGKAANWYSWTNFYRWVIGAAIGLLLAFGAFVGTVLLFEQVRLLTEQTERFKKQTELMDAQTKLMGIQTNSLTEQNDQAVLQNEIMTLSLVSELRTQLLNSAQEVDYVEQLVRRGELSPDRVFVKNSDGSCKARFTETIPLSRPPSTSTILAIAELGRKGSLADKVREALSFLMQDSNAAVRIGAMLVRDELDIEPIQGAQDDHLFLFDGLWIEELVLNTPRGLSFSGSVIKGLFCDDCYVRYDKSIVLGEAGPNEFSPSRDTSNSIVFHAFNTLANFGVGLGSLVIAHKLEDESELHGDLVVVGDFGILERSIPEPMTAFLDSNTVVETETAAQNQCTALKAFARSHPFVEYSEN